MATVTNDAAYWREFDNNAITHSAAHYLMAVDSLKERLGYARVTDVAEMLDISRGAASMALSHLKKRGWITEDPNRFLLLTDEGMRMANLVEQKFKILYTFFEEVLGVSTEVALSDACKMEHLMSLETGRRLVWLMRYILGDPAQATRVQKAMECFQPGCESVEQCPLCNAAEDCLTENIECQMRRKRNYKLRGPKRSVE